MNPYSRRLKDRKFTVRKLLNFQRSTIGAFLVGIVNNFTPVVR